VRAHSLGASEIPMNGDYLHGWFRPVPTKTAATAATAATAGTAGTATTPTATTKNDDDEEEDGGRQAVRSGTMKVTPNTNATTDLLLHKCGQQFLLSPCILGQQVFDVRGVDQLGRVPVFVEDRQSVHVMTVLLQQQLGSEHAGGSQGVDIAVTSATGSFDAKKFPIV